MTKIVAAFDGLKFSESTLQYATDLALENNAHLVGVFLDDITYTSYKIYDLIYEKGGVIGSAKKKLDKKDEKTRATSVKKFEDRCKDGGIKYTLHRDRSIAIQELLHESIYADLLIVDCTETFTHYNEKLPTDFIRHLLINAQCPVLIVPHLYKPIEKVTILYDGEPSSVHAIKMFSYVLPASTNNSAEVISVKQQKQSFHIPDNRLMKEFMKRHFNDATYTVLKGLAESEIVSYIKKQKENTLVVLGAYRRNMVSRWFRASMADALMQELKMPLFIAHNK